MVGITAPTWWLSLVTAVAALDNGFGRTPVMGYNTYNAYACTVNETIIEGVINSMASQGWGKLGYKYVQMDCGWASDTRQANGSIAYDTSVFPNGISPLAKLAISKGFKWSMYTDEGYQACDTGAVRAGSEGYEQQDAAQFAGWNVAYMKVDNCYADAGNDAPHDARSDFVTRYSAWSTAQQAYGIEGMLVCQWGVPYIDPDNILEGPAQWTPNISTSFRVSDDIANGYIYVQRIMNEAINVNLRGLSGPGHFADMDLLEIGNNGMTFAEEQSHFAVWAMFKSALMISTRLDALSSQDAGILSNKRLIAVNQDSLGQPVVLRQRYTNDNDQFYGKLSNGQMAILILDQSNTARSLTLNLAQYNISSATVTDLWNGTVVKKAKSYTVNVQPHGNLAVRLSNIVHAKPSNPALNYYPFSNGTFANGASPATCTSCGTGQKAGNIGGSTTSSGGSVTISGISTSQTSQNVLFDYINCDIGFLYDTNTYSNVRGASISVNGGSPVNVLFPISGYNWSGDVLRSFRVFLSGFVPGSNNTITVSGWGGTTQWAPDLDQVGVLA